jgi:hypothetical protein|tara:strand:- start:9 stop:191 length:183 start_codon:yes stop_codon:yes gene_type:complete
LIVLGEDQIPDEEAQEIVDDMDRLFGPLPNPIHEPKRALSYLKRYRYYLIQNKQKIPGTE